jgi:hypothetical protein
VRLVCVPRLAPSGGSVCCSATPYRFNRCMLSLSLLLMLLRVLLVQIPEQVLLFMQQNKYKPNNKDATSAAVS